MLFSRVLARVGFAAWPSAISNIGRSRAPSTTARILSTSGSVWFSGKRAASQVAFRCDDIQSWWITDAQKAIVNTFTDKSAKLSVGIVGDPLYFGDDDGMATFISDAIATGAVEAANHSTKDEEITNEGDAEAQAAVIMEANTYIAQTVGANVVTFVPPRNVFNDATLEALGLLSMDIISSSTGQDQCIASGNCLSQSPRHTPVGASTGGWTGTLVGQLAEVVFAEIEAQLEDTRVGDDAWAAVMVHPQEHTVNGAGVDTDQIAELGKLIDMVMGAGYEIVWMKDIAQ